MNSNDPYAGLMVIIYLGLFEAVLLGIISICGVWLMVASHRRKQGHPIADTHFRLPQKILLFSLITFAISFGLCSAWVYLPEVFR